MSQNKQTLKQQSEALAGGVTTSVELATQALQRVEENKHLNAFVVLDAEHTLEQAQAADQRRQANAALSPIDGIPIAIKDNYLTKDYPTTACSNAKPLEPAGVDASLVANLRNAGAVVFGKTNMDEWAFSPLNINSNIGPTKNPHNPEHITSGSSGGSAAAVSSGIVSAALGSDTGGSIRMPSAACGIYGFKPSYGRASRHGVLPLSWSLDAPGPLASSLDDIEMLLPYILGQDKKDTSTFQSRPFESLASDHETDINLVHLTGLRLERSDEVDLVFRQALDACQASVNEAGVPYLANYYSAWEAIIFSEAASYHQPLLASDPGAYSADLRVKLEAGLRLSAMDVLHAQKLRARLMHALMNDYGHWDAFVMPTLPIPAPRHDDEWQEFGADKMSSEESMLWFCFLGNLSGLPAVTIPIGKSAAGLPIGMMLLGRPGQDEKLLAIAKRLEKAIKA